MLGLQDKETECVTPEPDKAIVSGELEALLATATLPVTVPVAAGVNDAVSVADWPGFKMVPVETPLALNPAPEMLTFEIVIAEVPAFVSVTVLEPVVETERLPKPNDVALELRIDVAGLTARAAAALVTAPALLLSATLNCDPLSEVVVAGVV